MRAALVFIIFFAGSVFAASFQKGFVDIRKTQRLYVEYRPAEGSKPTLIFLNGLTWDTRDWQTLVSALDQVSPGLGIMLYDMQGQGKTLLDDAPIVSTIALDTQVMDFHQLRGRFSFSGPVILVGLSYGGGLGFAIADAYPKDFDQLILMSPFLQRLSDQDVYINAAVTDHRLMFPWDLRSDDELYDFYLRGFIYSTYPIAEPGLLENPFKLEATFRMVQGAKNFKAIQHLQNLGERRLHIMGGEDDPYVKDLELQGFWQHVPEHSRASYLRLQHTAHKISQIYPELTAQWIKKILAGKPELFQGKTFEINPETMKEETCSSRLKRTAN